MKKFASVLLFLSLIAPVVHAQDTLVTKSTTPLGFVYDANGKKIGPYYPQTNGNNAIVAAKINGVITPIALTGLLLQDLSTDNMHLVPYSPPGSQNNMIYYTMNDCAGSPYVSPSNLLGMVPSSTIGDKSGAGTIYIGANTPNLDIPNLLSRFESGYCQTFDNAGHLVVPVIQIIDLKTLYTPPYTLR